ncbi:hypothetical protein BSKO_04917 [Bryopsis sp. KO-2023]|nr:hypothetical protein BSKO_04917 [Bryopsis sp. KO-2023]
MLPTVDGVPVTVTILADLGKANQPDLMGSQGCADGNRSFLLGKEVLKSNSKGEVEVHFRFNSEKVGDSNITITADVPGGGNAVEMTIPVLERRKTVRVAKSSATEAKKKSNDQKEGPQVPQDVAGSNVAEQAVVSADESMPKVKRSRVQTNKQDTTSAAAASSGQHADPSAGQTWSPVQGGAMSIGSLNDFKKKKTCVRVSVPVHVPVPVPVSVSVPQVPVSVPQVPQVPNDCMEIDDDLTSPQFVFEPLPVKMNVDKGSLVPGQKGKQGTTPLSLPLGGQEKQRGARVDRMDGMVDQSDGSDWWIKLVD